MSPSNCEYECNKPCDKREYVYYENCNCRNNLVDRLVEECSENFDGNKMIHNGTFYDYGKICNSCTVYILLLVVFFIISIRISSVFIYFHWYLKRRCIETTIY